MHTRCRTLETACPSAYARSVFQPLSAAAASQGVASTTTQGLAATAAGRLAAAAAVGGLATSAS